MKNKKTLTLREFSDYIGNGKYKAITFKTDFQEDTYRKLFNTCKISVTAEDVCVKLNPNIIYLQISEGNFIYFDRVKYAEVEALTNNTAKAELICSEKQTHILYLNK